MLNVFDQNDRAGKKPNIAVTLEGLSVLLDDKMKLLKRPFIMTSGGTTNRPYLGFQTPYFQGSPIEFNPTFRRDTKFAFYVIANTFKETFSSHALIGYWDGPKGTLTFFDPNGDFYTPDPESVYNGYGFFLAPQIKGLKNPLYNTLLGYFKTKVPKMNVYTGPPIVCPRNSKNTCAYRSFMYILALIKAEGNLIRAKDYTSKMAMENLNQVKEIIELSKNYIDISAFPMNMNQEKKLIKDERNKILNVLKINKNTNNKIYQSV